MTRTTSEPMVSEAAQERLVEGFVRVHLQSCVAARELESAAMSLSSDDLRRLVMLYASAERQRARELSTMIEAVGGHKPATASIVLARSGVSNQALIGGCRSEQRSLRRAYERLLAGDLPERFVPELRAHLEAVRRAENYLRILEEHAEL